MKPSASMVARNARPARRANSNPLPCLRTIDPVTRTFSVGVGGILNIAGNQPDGVYSATFQVTANYL